jgi:hypothetical protein
LCLHQHTSATTIDLIVDLLLGIMTKLSRIDTIKGYDSFCL